MSELAEGARLEIVCMPTKVYRGFESPSLRHLFIIGWVAGPRGTENCEPRQVRKEAAATTSMFATGSPGYLFFDSLTGVFHGIPCSGPKVETSGL
jgi:hypothetical protein